MTLKNAFEKQAVKIMTWYIDFVYKTSNILINDAYELLSPNNIEGVTALFWHGDSYCLYPAFKNSKLYIAVTKDRRGDYISDICAGFGYKTLRLPDVSHGENDLFRIRNTINAQRDFNIAISLDGPLGPYHVPKDFAIVCSLVTKKKLSPISLNVKRKIELSNRWDRFKIPLPFNVISIDITEPIEVTKMDKTENFSSLKSRITAAMEKLPIDIDLCSAKCTKEL